IECIYHNSFAECTGMTGELKLPSSLKVIGDHAFTSTGFTGELVLPDTLESIGDGSFSDCTGLTSIRAFPATLKHIKEDAFGGCTSLKGELVFPERMTFLGEKAFWKCPVTKVTFGKDFCSIGEGAFRECEALKSVTFTGDIPDYYGADEEHPSFPEGCDVDSPDNAVKLFDMWAKKASEPSAAGDKDGEEVDACEEPYYWTQAITGFDFTGDGYYADVVLLLDDSTLLVSVNGRKIMEVPYFADKNAYEEEDQVVTTSGFYCRGGWIKDLKYERGFWGDDRLCATMTKDDGSSEEIIFHTDSEEYLYFKED
ncbi:MAG: leucine-rich repeat domain-containing protein, partial [Lachnospiraceae bacterium]|nr:leucine-rich repeat domain-containing protein [Lachnospiraceae bacterium]